MANYIYNKRSALLVVLLFFVWGGISYQWYSCGIKGFCLEKTTIFHIGGSELVSVEHTSNDAMAE